MNPVVAIIVFGGGGLAFVVLFIWAQLNPEEVEKSRAQYEAVQQEKQQAEVRLAEERKLLPRNYIKCRYIGGAPIINNISDLAVYFSQDDAVFLNLNNGTKLTVPRNKMKIDLFTTEQIKKGHRSLTGAYLGYEQAGVLGAFAGSRLLATPDQIKTQKVTSVTFLGSSGAPTTMYLSGQKAYEYLHENKKTHYNPGFK